MKKFFCYLALIVLIGLIILPPTLRVFVKDEIEIIKGDTVELLSCIQNDETISMSYLNDKATNIKYIVGLEEKVDEAQENTSINEDVTLRETLEGITNISKSTTEESITYFIDINDESVSILIPDKFMQTISLQKDFYTNLGYTCNIIK